MDYRTQNEIYKILKDLIERVQRGGLIDLAPYIELIEKIGKPAGELQLEIDTLKDDLKAAEDALRQENGA